MAEEIRVLDFDELVEINRYVTRKSMALDILKAIRGTVELYYTLWEDVDNEEEEQYGVPTALDQSIDVVAMELDGKIESIEKELEERFSKIPGSTIDLDSVNKHFSKEETPDEKMERIIREIYEKG